MIVLDIPPPASEVVGAAEGVGVADVRVGAGVAGTGVGAGVGALEVGMTAGKIASTTEPVTTASASPLLASSLLMAAVRAADSAGGTATLNSTFSVPSKSLNSRTSS